MVDPVKKGDPHWDAYVKVQQWHNTIECMPTWDELREMEMTRQSGEINMMAGALKNYLNDNGYYYALCWYLRCREHNAHWSKFYGVAIEAAEREHGPKSTWFTDDDRLERRRHSIDIQMERLRQEARELERERAALRVKKDPDTT